MHVHVIYILYHNGRMVWKPITFPSFNFPGPRAQAQLSFLFPFSIPFCFKPKPKPNSQFLFFSPSFLLQAQAGPLAFRLFRRKKNKGVKHFVLACQIRNPHSPVSKFQAYATWPHRLVIANHIQTI